MRLENRFEVPAAPSEAWSLLNDVPRIVPCMPGTQLTDTVDADTWKATMHVKLGPIGLQFLVDLRREESDAAARRALLRADARELKGRGGARATIESRLEQQGQGTQVMIVTELTLHGAVAQYGRGVVGQVAEQLTAQFAECLGRQLEGAERSEPVNAQPASAVNGLRLLWSALRHRLGRRTQ